MPSVELIFCNDERIVTHDGCGSVSWDVYRGVHAAGDERGSIK